METLVMACAEHTHMMSPALMVGGALLALIAARAIGKGLASWLTGGTRGRR